MGFFFLFFFLQECIYPNGEFCSGPEIGLQKACCFPVQRHSPIIHARQTSNNPCKFKNAVIVQESTV